MPLSEQMSAHLRRALNALAGRGKNAIGKTRRLQEARRARENDLRELLASSLDAIVVTNVDRRFVAANPKALHLFGVSEANIRQFTIDAFLLGQIRYFDGNGLSFISREEKQGECQIRRLDGSLRLTEYMNIFSLPILSLLVIYSDSVTIANAHPEDELPPDKRDTVCGQPKSSAPAPAPLRGFPSCKVVEWKLALFSERRSGLQQRCLRRCRNARSGSATLSGVEIAVILLRL